ncbi:MAG: CPBP family intramembrane metalloprotease [Planctomycetales bacterium]|nr:CPBP family intramembrane metalloprotease [bacterium]UNM06992.1 MAG: CPBP family intramembrane metalloprotease [Planctomycetales bacterium]
MDTSKAISTAVVNLIVLAGIPLGIYALFHSLKHKRGIRAVLERAGLCIGETRYLLQAAIASLAVAIILFLVPFDLSLMTHEGNAMAGFAGAGIKPLTFLLALLYGFLQTGFCEELFFRGLIAGSLSRRVKAPWANILQALIFLLPHLILLAIAPQAWPLLIVIFAGGLYAGWLRISSGSILAPWLLHATANSTMCLVIASRTVAA